jgi:hypothetical protein
MRTFKLIQVSEILQPSKSKGKKFAISIIYTGTKEDCENEVQRMREANKKINLILTDSSMEDIEEKIKMMGTPHTCITGNLGRCIICGKK